MALTPPPFNTSNDLDPLAALCQDLGLGIPAPTVAVAYDAFQLEFLEVGTKNYLILFIFLNNIILWKESKIFL